MKSEEVQHIVQINLLPHVQMIRGLCHVVEQELKQQGAAKLAALNLEVGKAHREIGVLNRVNADEAGVFYRSGEAVAARGTGAAQRYSGPGSPRFLRLTAS